MAAKPMVLYESDDFIAMASEEVAIRQRFPARDRHLRSLRRGGTGMEELNQDRTNPTDMGMHTEQLAGRTQQMILRSAE